MPGVTALLNIENGRSCVAGDSEVRAYLNQPGAVSDS